MKDGKNGWSSLHSYTPPLAWGERVENQKIRIHLSGSVVYEIDKIRETYRWDFPEAMAYRGWFIETAVRFFIAHLKEKGLVAEPTNTNA